MSKEKDIVMQMVRILTTPIAQREGLKIHANDCQVWAEELEKYSTEANKYKDSFERIRTILSAYDLSNFDETVTALEQIVDIAFPTNN